MLAVNTSGERCEEVVTVNGVVFIPPVEKKKTCVIGHFEKYHNTLLCASSALIGGIYSSLLC